MLWLTNKPDHGASVPVGWNTVSFPRKTVTSSTPLQKPKSLQAGSPTHQHKLNVNIPTFYMETISQFLMSLTNVKYNTHP
jgi:hypothetical protein